MPYLTWMADVLRAAGLPVQEVGGWRTRGHGQMGSIAGVLLHHTAGPASGNYPSLDTVQNGRPGLDGPLCNLGLARDGTWLVIAAGQAWHAGTGYASWCGRDNGNSRLIGVEAESTGRGDWTPAQLTSYPRGVAALLRYLGHGADRALAHKEWATPKGRKPDPAGWPGDMTGFRAAVAGWIRNPRQEAAEMATPQEVAAATLDMELGREGKPPTTLSKSTTDNSENFLALARVEAKLNVIMDKLDGQSAAIQQAAAKNGMTAEEFQAALASGAVRVEVHVSGGSQ